MGTGCCTKPLSRVLKRRKEEKFHKARSSSIYIGVLHPVQSFWVGASMPPLCPHYAPTVPPRWHADSVAGSGVVLSAAGVLNLDTNQESLVSLPVQDGGVLVNFGVVIQTRNRCFLSICVARLRRRW